jgi:Zn2+/Cd2+-exporting ATPase
LIAMLIGLIPIARRAAHASTPFSVEVLTSIAAVGAVIIGATEEAG